MWVAMSRTTAAVVVAGTFLAGGIAGWCVRGGPGSTPSSPPLSVSATPPTPTRVDLPAPPSTKAATVPSRSTPAPVPAVVKPSPTAGHWYRLSASDTLSEIARRAYGTTKRTVDVVAANPGLDPQRLQPGQLVYLPRANETAPPAPPPSPARTPAPAPAKAAK